MKLSRHDVSSTGGNYPHFRSQEGESMIPITLEGLINRLEEEEPNAITKVMAFMSYNPSIGRALEKGGVDKFQSMVLAKVHALPQIMNQDQFNKFHNLWMQQFMAQIKDARGGHCSVGQAQKAINVFLKLYVDWAKLPDQTTAERLDHFLHVPLDRIMMTNVKELFPDFFETQISPLRNGNYTHSLSRMERREYKAWQNFFRGSHPPRPILFDIIWALNRRNGGGA